MSLRSTSKAQELRNQARKKLLQDVRSGFDVNADIIIDLILSRRMHKLESRARRKITSYTQSIVIGTITWICYFVRCAK
jgi:hypothetical protein